MQKAKSKYLRFPVISQGAEHLVQGYLMRRNILAYKAPTNNEGYDLICIHPDPRHSRKPVRVQVKSRTASDCHYEFPLKPNLLKAFDFLIVVFLNVGRFGRNCSTVQRGRKPPEFFTYPASLVRAHHLNDKTWPKVRLSANMRCDCYRGDADFELIARKLRIQYPTREVRS